MVVWVLIRAFEEEPQGIIFGSKKDAISYAKDQKLIENKKDKYGYQLKGNEYSLHKRAYYVERAC